MRKMRVSAFLLLLLLIKTLSCDAQTTLQFPISLSVQDLSTTGIALVNTSSTPATAVFYLYGNDGTLVTSNSLIVPAAGQTAKLASDALASPNAGGWIQITSTNNELQGFELVGDFMTKTDGAGPAVPGKQLAVVALSSSDVIYIANTTSQSGTVQITLNDPTGVAAGTKSVALSAFQPVSFKMSDISGGKSGGLLSMSSNVAISASLITNPAVAGPAPVGQDIGVTNAVPVSAASSNLFFSYAPSGPVGSSVWNSIVGIANLDSSSQNITLTFTPDAGTAVSIQKTIPAGGSFNNSVADLFSFSLPATAFTAGWIRVSGSGPLIGVVAYQDASVGSLATVPSQSTGATAFFFGHIASLPPWFTGIALLNSGTTAANVEIYALDPSGKLIGTVASFSLAAGTRKAALLSELVPQVLQRSSDGGFVFVRTTNSVPLLGFELFGHSVFPILANVQGFALPATSTFVPPGASASVSISALSTTDGTNAQTQFNPGDTIVYDATITASGGATGSAQITFTVKDPRNQTMLSTTSSIQVPAGSTDVVYISYIPKNALGGSYSVTATLVYQASTVSKTATVQVSGGNTTPTVAQDSPISLSTSNLFQASFRPGDTVRFQLRFSNFTSQNSSGTVNYQLIGPGFVNVGTGTLTITIPPGLSTQTVDMPIPSSMPIGLLAFSTTLTAGSFASNSGTSVTNVPKNTNETISINSAFVADSNGIPQDGFTPNSSILLQMWRISTFGVATPASVRYLVTGPGSSTILDQTLSLSLPNGASLGYIPFTLPATAAIGAYTFKASVTYQDNNNVTQTSSQTTTFTIQANPPALPPTISVLPPVLQDIDFVERTSFSPGEPAVILNAYVYSTSPTPVSGTVQYQITLAGSSVFNYTVNVTLSPGVNSGYIGVTNVPLGTYGFALVVTAQGQTYTASTPFSVTGAGAPTVNFLSADERSVRNHPKFSRSFAQKTSEYITMDDGLYAIGTKRP